MFIVKDAGIDDMTDPIVKKTVGDGVEIALACWEGQGSAILCVHGISASCRCWDNLAEAMSPLYTVMAMDLRGRGFSDKPATGYSVSHHCRDIEALLTHEKLDQVVLFGHSLGALIGLEFAARYPDKVERLVLLDGGGQLTAEQRKNVFAGIQPTLDRLGKVFPSKEAYLDLMQRNPLLNPWTPELENYYLYELEEAQGGVRSRVKAEHIKEEADSLTDYDITKFYPLIKCPVLILRAPEGMAAPDNILLPQQALDKMLEEIPDVKYVDIPGSNHYSIVMQPQPVRDEVILKFLNQ
jgi:pimeloyl-ACP methyl ester carboxylesterase